VINNVLVNLRIRVSIANAISMPGGNQPVLQAWLSLMQFNLVNFAEILALK
jgi:hypothetical protein